MSEYAWPGTAPFLTKQTDMWLENTDVVERSVFGGGQQTSGQPGAHWQMSLLFPKDHSAARLQLAGFLRKLNGKEHRALLWDFRKFGLGGHGYPAGTINTTGVQVKTSKAQFGITLDLKNCGADATLLPGDMWSVNGQLVENCELATADGAGDMTVLVPHRLRATALANAAITLIRPTAKFVLSGNFHLPRDSAMYDEMAVDFEEVFS